MSFATDMVTKLSHGIIKIITIKMHYCYYYYYHYYLKYKISVSVKDSLKNVKLQKNHYLKGFAVPYTFYVLFV